MSVFGAVFEVNPANELTAIFKLIAVVAWVLAAFAAGTLGRRAGGAVGLVGLGLALWLFPDTWVTLDQAF